MSISLFASNVAQLITNLVFLEMINGMTAAGTFGFFLLMNILTYAFVYYLVVETRELASSEILRRLRERYEQTISDKGLFKFCRN